MSLLPYVALGGVLLWLATMSLALPRTAAALGGMAALGMFLLAALRGNSVDYQEYEVLFMLMDSATGIEPLARIMLGKDALFGSMMLGIIEAGLGSQWLFATSAALSVGSKWFAFRRAFPHPAVALAASFFLFYFLHDFTQVRVAVAIGFCYLSLEALIRGEKRMWLLHGVLATGFHISALLFVALSVVHGLNPRLRWPAMLVVVVAGVLLSRVVAGLVGEFDTRLTDHTEDVTGTSIVTLINAVVRLGLLGFLVRRLLRLAEGIDAERLRLSFLFCVAGIIMLFGLREIASAFAFRFYELLDAFSVFIVATALIRGAALDRSVAVLLALGSLAIYARGGLLVPYTLGSF